jgi:hypothetical protein
MKQILYKLALCITLLIFASNVLAQAPRNISYQGMLLDDAKNPVTGVHTITVKLYDAPVEGILLHSESFTASVQNGVFNAILGSQVPFEPSLNFDKQYWIALSIDDGADMTPRTALTSIPYAIHA